MVSWRKDDNPANYAKTRWLSKDGLYIYAHWFSIYIGPHVCREGVRGWGVNIRWFTAA